MTKNVIFIFVVFLSGSLAHAVGPTCKINQAPINESYQIMLGRDASHTEACHYASVIKSGMQVAYFEPYYYPMPTVSQAMKCGWVSYTYDPKQVGITDYNATEWNQRFAGAGYLVTALYRTLLGKVPIWNSSNPGNTSNPQTLGYWVDVLEALSEAHKSGDGPTPLQQLSTKIQSTFTGSINLSSEVINFIFRRELNREPNLSGCSLTLSSPPQRGTDCYFLYALAKGDINVSDAIHFVRSTTEYIKRNEMSSCYSAIYPQGLPPLIVAASTATSPSPLDNQHALGEYVAEIYRIFLNRYPTSGEVAMAMAPYSGGDTQNLLKQIAGEVLAKP